MNPQNPDWASLSAKYGSAAVEYLRGIFQEPGSFAVTEDDVSSTSKCSPHNAGAILDALAQDGLLTVALRTRCPYCRRDLDEEQTQQPECAHCSQPFDAEHPLQSYRIYARTGDRSRDVKWVVTIHGMNTDGTWQQECAWRLAQLYGYSIPVAIYKYGNIKISPLIPGRRRYLTRRLIKNLKRYSNEIRDGRYGDRPDVIAHSFGTWLLYKALLKDEHVKVGRVILTGSIIPPDFDWTDLIQTKKQVQAVLCHHAAKDMVVRMAQYCISGSGPSGYRGFNRGPAIVPMLVHKLESAFHHSDFFLSENLSKVMGTVWAPFLTAPNSVVPSLGDPPPSPACSPWSPSLWRYVTLPLKTVLLALLLLACVFTIVSALCGMHDTWRWMWMLIWKLKP